jgi:hypothetical protein
MSTNFHVHAEELQRGSLRLKVCRDEAKRVLEILRVRILDAHDHGKTSSIVTLPAHFVSRDVDSETIRVYVYSTCIQQLKKNGFSVQIEETDRHAVLYIDWQDTVADQAWKAMQAIIDEHRRV